MYAGGGELTENIDDVGGAGTAEFASKAIDIFYMWQEFGADGTTEENRTLRICSQQFLL